MKRLSRRKNSLKFGMFERGHYIDTAEDGITYETTGIPNKDGRIVFTPVDEDFSILTISEESAKRRMVKKDRARSSSDDAEYTNLGGATNMTYEEIRIPHQPSMYNDMCINEDSSSFKLLKRTIVSDLVNCISFNQQTNQACLRSEKQEDVERITEGMYSRKHLFRKPNIDHMYFYRAIKSNRFYNPSRWEIGSINEQIIPMSTTISKDVAIRWLGSNQCCLFMIEAIVDDDFFFVCPDTLDIPPEKVTDLDQVEVTLPPGILIPKERYLVNIEGIDRLVIRIQYKAYSERQWLDRYQLLEKC